MTRVSILMNGFNSQEFLKESIDSVYAQTFKDWEIVFIDNCSTDDTKSIVDSFDDKIKYYKTNENIPLGAARNFGLKYCNREYLAFLDTDDLWVKNKLSRQIGLMDSNIHYQFCYSGVVYIDKNNKTLKTTIPKSENGYVFAQQLISFEINMLSALVRNNIKIKINENLRHAPDYQLFMNMAFKYKAYVIKEPLVKYRKYEHSLTSMNIDVWWLEMKNVLDDLSLNSNVKYNYPKEIRMAYAKVAYHKAQYLMSIENKKEARRSLSKFKFLNMTYFALYLTASFSKKIWDFSHRLR
jgi:glycosyltransferase involved in cell wall biosynthesis